MEIPNLDIENKLFTSGYDFVAGVDEAGRGPWAGPVVAGVVLVDKNTKQLDLVKDSKKMTEKKREEAFDGIQKSVVSFGIGEGSVEEIDELGILPATRLAMKSAFQKMLDKLSSSKSAQGKIYTLVDGYFKTRIGLGLKESHITRGDQNHYSIAAASILAKVHRDKLMKKLALEYPLYEFDKHKGYGTKAHREALLLNGPCEIHRKSFKPVKELLED